MPVKTPTDYNELVKLTDTIDTIKTLRQRIDENNERIKTLEGVEIDYRHPELPFAKAVKVLDEQAEAPSAWKKTRAICYALLIGMMVGALPLAAYWFIGIEAYLPSALQAYDLYLTAGLAAVLLLVLFFLTRKPIRRRVESMTRNRIVRKRQSSLGEVKEQAGHMATSANEQIKTELNRRKRQLKEDETNLMGLERKIQQETLVPEHMLPQLSRLLTYYKHRRADTIKEAINLMKAEDQRTFELKRMLYGIRHEDVPIDDVFDPDYSLDDKAEDDFVGPPVPTHLRDAGEKNKDEPQAVPAKTPSLSAPIFDFLTLETPKTDVSTAEVIAQSEAKGADAKKTPSPPSAVIPPTPEADVEAAATESEPPDKPEMINQINTHEADTNTTQEVTAKEKQSKEKKTKEKNVKEKKEKKKKTKEPKRVNESKAKEIKPPPKKPKPTKKQTKTDKTEA